MAGNNAITRGPLLARLTRTALAAGNLEKAETPTKRWWNRSTASFGGPATPFTRETSCSGGWRCAAETWRSQALPAGAGKTPGSSSLAAQGPNMALARDLRRRGAPVPGGMRRILEWKPRETGRMDGSHSRRAEAGFRCQRGVLVSSGQAKACPTIMKPLENRSSVYNPVVRDAGQDHEARRGALLFAAPAGLRRGRGPHRRPAGSGGAAIPAGGGAVHRRIAQRPGGPGRDSGRGGRRELLEETGYQAAEVECSERWSRIPAAWETASGAA
jgi:hypothetical protein